MKKEQVKELEKEVLENFNNDNYSPLGADGGCLKYIYCNTKYGLARASITLDSEIAKIRSIWELSLDIDGKGFNKNVYNLTKEYYKLRN